MLDVREAFDLVNKDELLRICRKNNLSSTVCQWIDSFMQNRKMQLAFDSEITQWFDLNIGVSQDSSVSSVLYLIFISELFKNNHYLTRDLSIRMFSYIDDIAILVSSKIFRENCQKLKTAAKRLIDWGKDHFVLFELKKTELIHFDFSRRATSSTHSVKINDLVFESKETVRYLNIWFDRKLNFKEHVQKRITQATRMFHSISRLASTVRDLSFKAMRKLYIACIASIADYDVSIWWKQQQSLLNKFDKLQNQVLRKILNAFKTSAVVNFEIEACLVVIFHKIE